MKWEKSRLNDIVKLTKGKKHTEVEYPVGYRYLQIEDLHGTGITKYTNDQGVECITSDILIAWDGANAGKVGTGLQGMAGSTLARIRIISDRVSSRYLYWYLFSNFEVIKSKRTGATIPHVSGSELRSMEVPLPPLHIQEQIADTLDKADALRKKDKELLKKYDELAQSIFYDMFGDPERNDKNWPVKTLEDITYKIGDGIHGTPVYDENGEYFFINGNNLTDGKIIITKETKRINHEQYLKHKRPLNQDTILVSINGTIGKVAFYKEEKILLGKSACFFNIRRNYLVPEFIFYLISSPYFIKYATSAATGSTIKNVSLKTMRNLPVPVPPLHLQQRFLKVLEIHTSGFLNLTHFKSFSLYSSLLKTFYS
jgi:type I restriction enzyme S subunit